MIDKKTGIQYEIMTQKVGDSYVPNFDALIEEAPCEEMAQKWIQCRDLIERTKNETFSFDGFAFRLVVCAKQSCGHYEILQHPYGKAYNDVDEILESFANEGRKCTMCICG